MEIGHNRGIEVNCLKIKRRSHYISHFVLVTILVFSPTISNIYASERKAVDSILLGEYVVTMTDDQMVIENGAVAVSGNKIVAVGKAGEILKNYHSEEILKGQAKILMPGLINGHTHAAMTLFRGMADDLKLMDWLNNYIFPMEGQFVNPSFVAIGSKLACWEMIKGGTTTFVDMYFYPEVTAEQTVNCGLRAVIGSASIDYPSPGFKGWDDSFAAAIKFVKHWQNKHERIIPAFAPHAPYTVSPEHLKQVADRARKLKTPVSIHIAETISESEQIKTKYHTTPVAYVANSGLFDGVTLIAAHMVYPADSDMAFLIKDNVGAIHNPTSNLKLAAGISPVVKMINQGVQVGLGTDGAASNNDLDMWEEIRMTALIHKVAVNDSTAISAITALKMATSMGAKAIGLGEITGQLKVGMRADMIQLSIDELRHSPLYDVISHLVYVADSTDVVTTMVSGKLLMLEGKVITIDEKNLKEAIIKETTKIKTALQSRVQIN